MEEYVNKLIELLNLEHQAELTENEHLLSQLSVKELERKGVCLRKLTIVSQRCGFYGRTVYKLETSRHLNFKTSETDLSNKVFSAVFSVGDIVTFISGAMLPSDNHSSGIVTHVTSISITVAFDQPPFCDTSMVFDSQNLALLKIPSDVTYKRSRTSLDAILRYKNGPAQHLIAVCFENEPLKSPDPRFFLSDVTPHDKSQFKKDKLTINEFEIKLMNRYLNDSQKQAVVACLSGQDISIIHGPPGTGKTTTVVEVILQFVLRSKKVLVCAPSNIAVDNLLDLLAPHCNVVRLGHPARAAERLQKYTLDALVSSSDAAEVIVQVRKEIDVAFGHTKSGKKGKINWGEVKELRKELHIREIKAVYEVLNSAEVVISTTTSATKSGPLKALIDAEQYFDICVIDECAQATEPSCWIPLLSAFKCILSGDHLQLPPTIISDAAAKNGLAVTLMERLINIHGDRNVSMLCTQYRMNSHIMQWPSESLYGNKLCAFSGVANRLLCDLDNVETDSNTSTPLLFIDTAGCEMFEMDTPEEMSKGNKGEVGLVASHVEALLSVGVLPKEIAVIAPYSLQVELITQCLQTSLKSSKVEVHTVDGFQGREMEAVIISFTRSNTKGDVGFLREDRRTNVAITRAKRHLCIIGDSFTIGNQPFIKGLMKYIKQYGEVKSAFEYAGDDHGIEFINIPHISNSSNKYKDKNKASENKARENMTRIENQVRSFAKDINRKSLDFSANLTAQERYFIHSLAEELNLFHNSTGVGKKRSVLISKGEVTLQNNIQENAIEREEKVSCKEFTVENQALDSLEEISPESQELILEAKCESNLMAQDTIVQLQLIESVSIDSLTASNGNLATSITNHDYSSKLGNCIELAVESNVLSELAENTREHTLKAIDMNCDTCGSKIPHANIVLHQIHCQKKQQNSEPTLKCIENVSKPKINKSNKKATQFKSNTSLTEGRKDFRQKINFDEDVDVLDAAIQINDTCSFTKCEVSVKLIGNYCKHCKLNYCFAHTLPEVHGCGQKAKKEAREIFKENKKQMTQKERAELEKHYKKILEEKNSERTTKKVNKKK